MTPESATTRPGGGWRTQIGYRWTRSLAPTLRERSAQLYRYTERWVDISPSQNVEEAKITRVQVLLIGLVAETNSDMTVIRAKCHVELNWAF